MPDEAQFKDMQIGQKFNHAGTTYIKTALAMAEDEKRTGTILLEQTIVELPEDNPATANPS